MLQGEPSLDDEGFQAALHKRLSNNQVQEERRKLFARWSSAQRPRRAWGVPVSCLGKCMQLMMAACL